MKKRLAVMLLLLACILGLCGCGNLFEKEYVFIADTTPPPLSELSRSERVTVATYNELKRTILNMVYSGESGGTIDFDQFYTGSPVDDLENACWEVRTQDALSVYCVQNMSFSIEKIVTFYEAAVEIEYTAYATDIDSIVQVPYAVGIRDLLSTALAENRTHLAILINASPYGVEKIRSFVQDIYRTNPTICVKEPSLTVYMYSGAGNQRLYSIAINYGMTEDELIRRKSLLKNLDVESNLNTYGLDDAQKALTACRYIADNCLPGEEGASCYDALIDHSANSEGMALAYVELCRQLKLDCRIVYGQYNGSAHCWNIVKIDGDYYHVDPSVCAEGDYYAGFLRSEEDLWGLYRWELGNYPACNGPLKYSDVSGEEDLLPVPSSEGEAGEEFSEGEEELPGETGENLPEEQGSETTES